VLGIFLDTETNGLNAHKHKLLEIAYKIVDVTTGQIKNEFEAVIYQPKEEWDKSDPESLEVNGFRWEEVSLGRQRSEVAEEIISSFERNGIRRGYAVFVCQNPSFDRAFFSQLVDFDLQETLQWPYHWLDLASMYWAKSISQAKMKQALFPWETGFSKDKIALTFKLPREDQPHRAMNGVNHLLLCYRAVVGFPNAQ
jgi:DNA polymerase-3 subunit epsilon/oligoribonuclease